MNEHDIRVADREARGNHIYLSDPPLNDNWRSHAPEALGGRKWKGDCDDIASTALDILGKHNMPLKSRWRLLVAANGASEVNHMVAAACDGDGHFWIVGDTFDPTYPAGQCPHLILHYNRLDERKGNKAVWRDGAPFDH